MRSKFASVWTVIWTAIRKRPWAIAFVSLLLVLILWEAPIVKKTARSELSGTWMTHLGASLMYYTTRLDETVAELAQQGITTLYPAVWNHGHTLFDSQVVRNAGGSARNPWVNLPIPFSDPLSGLVTQTRRQQLRLIPWFEYGLMIPTDSEIIKRHPDWLTQRQDRSISDPQKSPSSNFINPLASLRKAILGKKQGWLNPFHADVQQFLIDLIVEVVTRYPVDGIQLDDHFGLPIEYGYDPYTVALYQFEHQGDRPGDASNPEWMEWRARKFTELMTRIYQAVKTARKDSIVSLSPNSADYAYRTSLQDWAKWVDLNLLDEVIVQLYRPTLTALQTELDNPSLQALSQKVPLGIGLYTGPFNQAKPARQIKREVEAVRSAGYAGTSFFCWETTFWIFRGRK